LDAPDKAPEEEKPEAAAVAAPAPEEKAPEEAFSVPAPASSAKAKKKKNKKKKKGKGAETAPDFSEAPSTAVTASVEPESRVQEGGSAREETENVPAAAPAAEPAVAPFGVEDTEPSVVVEETPVVGDSDAKQKEKEIEEILSEKKRQIEEVLAEKKRAIDEIFEARKRAIEEVASEKKKKAEADEAEAEAKQRQLDDFLVEKRKAMEEIQREKLRAIEEVHEEEAKEKRKALDDKTKVIEEIQREKAKALAEVHSMEAAEKRRAIEEIQREKAKALAEVAEKEEAEKRKAIEEVQAMKQKALAEVAERQKKEKQRSIVAMMKTHAAENVAERDRAEAREAKARAEAKESEAKEAKERAEAKEAALLEAHSASSETSDDREMIVHEEVSDEAARPLALEREAETRADRTADPERGDDEATEEDVPSPPPSPEKENFPEEPARNAAFAIEPPPLPVIPVAASIPDLEDEPTPMAPPAADAAIAAEAARAAENAAAADADAKRLRAIIAAAPTPTRDSGSGLPSKGVPGASPRLREALKKDEASRRRAAEEAKARLEEVEAKARRAAAAAAKAVARAASAPPPISESERSAWLAKHPYQPIAKAPYALSRHETHDADLFDAAEEAVVAYLEEQVTSRLVAAGVPASATGLDDFSYVRMMSEFRKRRAEETEALGPEDRARYETERAAILNHIAATSRAAMAERVRRDAERLENANAFFQDGGDDGETTTPVGATAKTLFSSSTDLNEPDPKHALDELELGALTGERLEAAIPKVMRGVSVRESLEGGA
jgi:hypothetical protein